MAQLRFRGVVLIALVLSLGLPLPVLAAEKSIALLGVWAASLELLSKPTMMWLKVNETPEHQFVASVFLNPGPTGIGPLGNLPVQREASSWLLASGAGPNQFRLDVRKEHDGFTATYSIGASSGRTQLRRVSSDLTTNASVTGAYVLPSGDHIYLRTTSYGADKVLGYLEETSGRIGFLYETGTRTYIGGRSFSLPDPVGVTATFKQSREVQMVWQRNGSKPLTATRSSAYKREEVRIPVDGAVLACEALIPVEAGAHAGVVLVPGSGGVARFPDYYVLADVFAEHGFASLVCDKRGTNLSTGDWRYQSFEQQARDIVAGMDYLRRRREVAPSQVGVWAFSQGTYPGPIAAVTGKAAFLILVAEFANRNGDIGVYVEQMRRSGDSSEEIARFTSYMTRWEQAILDNDFNAAERNQKDYAGARWLRSVPSSEAAFATDWSMARARLMWPYEPGPVLRKLSMPVLAFWGSEDLEAMPFREQPLLEQALREAGNRDFTFRVLQGADHGLMLDGASVQRVGYAPGYFGEVIEWLRQRVMKVNN
jgi:pimeloyl-ACP methyl ester carboxylesterase